jgi:putative tricarboxylic transport membrane protein
VRPHWIQEYCVTQPQTEPAPQSRLQLIVCARRGELFAAGALVAIGVFFIGYSLKLRLGDLSLPGPGFFPLALALALVGLAGWIGFDQWRQRASGETIALGHRDVIVALAAMMAVPPLFEPLGAYLTLGLFVVAMVMAIGGVSIVRAVLAAAVGMVACWFVFQVLLGVQLPSGPF